MAREYDHVTYVETKEFEPIPGTERTSARKYARHTTSGYFGSASDLWIDEQTGLVTVDPFKFEAWLDSLTPTE